MHDDLDGLLDAVLAPGFDMVGADIGQGNAARCGQGAELAYQAHVGRRQLRIGQGCGVVGVGQAGTGRTAFRASYRGCQGCPVVGGCSVG